MSSCATDEDGAGSPSDRSRHEQGPRNPNLAWVTEALLVGRTPAKLISEKSPVVSGALFEAERVDEQTFEGVRFEHCTFANVSFKGARLISCTFENCAFIDCYFRMTVLESSRFLGCKLISCDFPKAAFRQCSFVYSQFRSCFVPYAVFEPSLPTEANFVRRRRGADHVRPPRGRRVGDDDQAGVLRGRRRPLIPVGMIDATPRWWRSSTSRPGLWIWCRQDPAKLTSFASTVPAVRPGAS
jgi:hypothetical protein